jgi:predicted RNA-binding protein YlqC (UPF0109 family)
MYSPSDLLEELLEAIATTLVDHPEGVQVRAVQGQSVTILELQVHPEDVGQVIGHHGRIAQALRTIFGAAGMKQHKRVKVVILE